MPQRYDAVIVGGGHNGLVCAAYLADRFERVLVLERRHIVGGACVTEEIFPGYRFLTLSYVTSLFRPDRMCARREVERCARSARTRRMACSS